MPANTHIINRQVFEFECLHSEHAFQIRNKFGQDVQYKITGIINRVCDQLGAENTDIRIPQLEIDLGRISFDKLEQEIVLNFEKKFYEKLAGYKSLQPGVKPGLFAKEKSSLEIIKFFLLTGRLPWFAGKQDKNYLADLFEKTFAGEYAAIRNFIFLHLQNEKFIERLVGHADLSVINQIIRVLGLSKVLFSDVEKAISKVIEDIILFLENNPNKDSRDGDMTFSLQDSADRQQEIANILTRYLEGIQNAFFPGIQKLTLSFILKLISAKKDIHSIENFFELFEKLFEEKFELSRAVLHPILIEKQEYFQNLSEAVSNAKKELELEKMSAADEGIETDDIAEKKFYISNAGLILIANYLPAFFNHLKLLDDGKFTNKDSQVKAIFLLHYLCTGTEEAPEYILPLNKIVCGLPLEESLPSYLLLNENEKNECRELLSEIIYNWQKLGNSTIEALQEAFLNREAILSYENNGWKLLVERKGYDVLIDSLPWSFSHIKLSWMQDLIITEW